MSFFNSARVFYLPIAILLAVNYHVSSDLLNQVFGTLSDVPVNNIIEFERQEGVVIVTKIHGPHQLGLLRQSLCLLNYAYNSRTLYDIVVFTTTPLEDEEIIETEKLVAPANLTVVIDNMGLQNEIQALSQDRREKFLQRCGVSSPENLTWWDKCPGRIAYNWQAQFRALHIWTHPAIAKYRYMLFLDSDGFSTRVWTQDPVTFFIKNNLAILFDNFPQGNAVVKCNERIKSAFNTSICSGTLLDGKFKVTTGEDCTKRVPLIHGFFHITDLNFYRSKKVMQWQEKLIGDCFLCREFDDQVAVTVPAMMLAPERSFEMRSNGIYLDVYHNSQIDGKVRAGGFLQYPKERGNKTLYDICPITAGNR